MDKEQLERIFKSSELTMMEKMEKIKDNIKNILKDYSYLDLFHKLKVTKALKKSKDMYLELYELALEELLEEKKKELTLEEIDEILKSFKIETIQTRKFINMAQKELLSKEDISEKSKKLSEDDYNYKRLVVASKEGNLTDEQRIIIENERRKVDLIDAKSDLNIIGQYQDSIMKERKNKIL